jgi:hypothetical protein
MTYRTQLSNFDSRTLNLNIKKTEAEKEQGLKKLLSVWLEKERENNRITIN